MPDDLNDEKIVEPHADEVLKGETPGADPTASAGDTKVPKKNLGEVLVERGLVSRADLRRALEEGKQDLKKLDRILVELGIVSQEGILSCLSAYCRIPYLALGNYSLNREAVSEIPLEQARKLGVIAIDKISDMLLVAMADPLDPKAKAQIEKIAAGMKVSYFLSSAEDIETKLGELD